MFIFNPLLTVRNLARQGSSTLINLSGFTIGLVCVFFLYFYISAELSTDQFHTQAHKIYRAIRTSAINGTPYTIGVTAAPYAEAFALDFPEAIQEVTRAQPDDFLVSYEDKKFMEPNGLLADPNFFTFFSFPLKEGRANQVLREQNSIVLSEELAKKYFGDENPIGKTLTISNRFPFMVTGILGTPPGKSHLKFDFVIPIAFYEREEWFDNWLGNSLFTYLRIETPEIAANVNSQLPQFIDKYLGDNFKKSGARIDVLLEPLTDIYFNNETRYDPARHGDIKTIYILIVVGLGILFIACFNYVNLSIAQSFRRAKEVGIRKVLGGEKGRLVLQFLGESLFIVFLAVGLSVLLSTSLRPWLNSLFELEVTYNWLQPRVLIFLGVLVVAVLALSGIYPAMLLSSFRPAAVLKGKGLVKGGSLFLRKGLVVTQFIISICMISLTLLVLQQIRYMSEKELGFNKEAVMIIRNSLELRQHEETFVKELMSHHAIEGVTFMSGEPGGYHDATAVELDGGEVNTRMRIVIVDDNYLDVFGLKLIAGRNFSKDYKSEEEQGVIVNEKGLEELGLQPEEAVGKLVAMPGWLDVKRRIVGVVSDYHFSSLKDPIEPLILLNGESNWRVSIRIKPGMLREGADAVNDVYARLSPGYPIISTFLDERLNSLYANEQRQSRVFSSFSIVSIFLAALGILGLASYTAQQRQKEFGIRKVLGASGAGILRLISKEYMLLIGAAFVVAVPLSWYFIDGWLDGFAYRITLADNLHLFVLSGLLTGAIAIATITLKTYKAAVSNPIESIRYE